MVQLVAGDLRTDSTMKYELTPYKPDNYFSSLASVAAMKNDTQKMDDINSTLRQITTNQTIGGISGGSILICLVIIYFIFRQKGNDQITSNTGPSSLIYQ